MKSLRTEKKEPLSSVLVSAARGAAAPAQGSQFLHVCRRWWRTARLWWRCPAERRRAWAYTAACAGLSLTNVALLLWISYVQNALQSALSEKQPDAFYAAVRDFVLIIVIAAPLFALTDWVDACLGVAWRRWLTRHMLRAYFHRHAYYQLKLDPQALDNPDQRICDDVRSYTATSVALTIAIMRKLFNCVAFAGLLWSLAPRLAVFLIFYAVGGTWITAAGFGQRLMRLTYSVLHREADLRFALVRVRENAESIAFYAGDAREAELAGGRLARVIATVFAKVRWEAGLSLWQNAYAYATILLPSLLLCGRYFRGEIRFGDISQAAFAFRTIEAALSFIVTRLSDISQLAAQTDRLDALLSALVEQAEGLPGGVLRKPSDDGGIHVSGLTLTTPRGEQTLCRDLSLSLRPGQSLLVVGPSGVGKTSLMRAIAGLWSAGSGTISAPADMFFLPQRPYMPLGSLREQLTFPDSYAALVAARRSSSTTPVAVAPPPAGSAGGAPAASGGSGGKGGGKDGKDGGDSGDEEGGHVSPTVASSGSRRLPFVRGSGSGSGSGGGGAAAVAAGGYRRVSTEADLGSGEGAGGLGSAATDAELRELLTTACLPNLLARVGGLDAEADWSHMLSLGEQQRVSFARLLHHRPAVAFLDEATSALDTATERALYSYLQQHSRCYISIAHRRQLAAYHSHVLEAAGGGAWQLHTAADFLERLAREEAGR